MKLDAIKTIRIDDLKNAGGDIPAWMETFLYQLNNFIEQVGRAVQGNLSFADNVLCKVKQYTFTHGVELSVNPDSKYRVLGVLQVDTSGQLVTKFGWSRKTNGNVGVTFYFDAGGTTSASCTVLILLG